jgi:hypothetical protein
MTKYCTGTLLTITKKLFLISFQKLQNIYPLTSIKDVQAAGEASRPQRSKKNIQHFIKALFLTFYLDSGPGPAD